MDARQQLVKKYEDLLSDAKISNDQTINNSVFINNFTIMAKLLTDRGSVSELESKLEWLKRYSADSMNWENSIFKQVCQIESDTKAFIQKMKE